MSHSSELFLDHAATTPLHPDALGVMLPFFGNHFGAPGSLSSLGMRSRDALEEARTKVGRLINADPRTIVFTSGGTEANNLAVLGAAYAKGSKGRHIVTSCIEHPSILGACRHLEKEGFRVTIVPVDDQGRIDPGSVSKAVSDDTILISIMHAGHATGIVQPVEEIGAMARSKGIVFHVDAAQSIGKVSIDVRTLPVDLMSISSHKLYGPKGAGALYVGENARIAPVMFGCGQEKGMRPGMPDIPGLIGFGMACSIAGKDLETNSVLMVSLRESFEQQVKNRINGVTIHGAGARRLPHITNLSFEGAGADALAAYLSARDIIVSAVPVPDDCSEDFMYVLQAMHGKPGCAHGALRVSFGWETREKEVRFVVGCLDRAVARIRDFAHISRGREMSIFTFPDISSAASALDILEGSSIPFTVMAPAGLMHSSCAPAGVVCLSSHREQIGALLGENNVEIHGIHKLNAPCRTIEKKEKAFWKKVEQIKGDFSKKK